MKILLFGGSGQLGFDILQRVADLNFTIVSPVSSEVNVSNADQVFYLTEKIAPDIIINSAAYTNVDGAEQNPEEAFAINRDGAENVARAAAKFGARLIHISTDYVFDGKKGAPYVESDRPNPLNVYGRSKLDGEDRVLNVLPDRSLVLRTSWLHGRKGKNFVQTMLKLFAEREEIRVVNDQFGNPTWTGWVAEVVLDLTRIPCSGVMHAACGGITNWFEFTKEIHRMVAPELTQLKIKRIETQSTAEAGRKATRPEFSALDCSKLRGIIGREPMSWQHGLEAHLRELGYLKDR